MAELVVLGKISKVLDKVSGTSKSSGKDWVKQEFVLKTDDQYNNLYAFTLFGDEKVENFGKYNKVGDTVKVSFNVNTNEYNGKYFTSLNAWSIFKEGGSESSPVANEVESTDDLPF
jgi:hypothetical protein